MKNQILTQSIEKNFLIDSLNRNSVIYRDPLNQSIDLKSILFA